STWRFIRRSSTSASRPSRSRSPFASARCSLGIHRTIGSDSHGDGRSPRGDSSRRGAGSAGPGGTPNSGGAGVVGGGAVGGGGFWAWDPVENASFLPWLTGTAFLHSVMVQERKNMLKLWNVWLIIATYALTVFGTFLTRSGIVQSIHAFASTNVGGAFLGFLG